MRKIKRITAYCTICRREHRWTRGYIVDDLERVLKIIRKEKQLTNVHVYRS